MVRDPLAVRAKLIECILIAVFYGIMFYRTPNYFTNPEDFQYTWDQVMDINVSSSKTYIVEFFFLGFNTHHTDFPLGYVYCYGRSTVYDDLAFNSTRNIRFNLYIFCVLYC